MVKKRNMGSKLTVKETMAVDALMQGATMAEAMRAANYADSTCEHQQVRFFQRPKIKKVLNERRYRARKEYKLDEDWVIQRLMRIANAGEILARFKKVDGNGQMSWDFTDASQDDLAVINELTVTSERDKDGVLVTKTKIGVSDPKGALDSLCRKLGLFNDKLNLSGGLSLMDRLQAGRKRAAVRDEDGSEPA